MSSQPSLDFACRRLSNGLTVLLHRDSACPVVAVDLWYHVGSKDEHPDATGLAHLFEHLMFQGSRHYPTDYIAALQELGAVVNGGTSYDRTGYHEVVPTNALEIALAMESDRMGHLLEALTDEKLATQKDVVINEYRQQYANRPYGLSWQWLAEELYPASHPYSWMTIGKPEHVAAADREQVSAFFRRWYTPDNATLCLSGDFAPAQAEELVERYFGEIPPGRPEARRANPPPMVTPPEPGHLSRRRDRVSLSRLYLVWHTVPLLAADDAPLDVLADVLCRGKTSRLYRRLVYELQVAQNVSAEHWSRQLAGLFYIVVTGKPGVELDQLRGLVDEELDRLRAEPPSSAEMARAWNRREAGFVYSIQSVLGKAERLNLYRLMAGDPGFLAADMERYRRVSAQDLQTVLTRYLAPERRAEMRIEPA